MEYKVYFLLFLVVLTQNFDKIVNVMYWLSEDRKYRYIRMQKHFGIVIIIIAAAYTLAASRYKFLSFRVIARRVYVMTIWQR